MRPTYRPIRNADLGTVYRTSDGSTFATEADAQLHADPVDFWAFFPGLPRAAVIEALRIIEDNEWESSVSYIREVADREARDAAHDAHERHVNLKASCYLCRIEAGAQTDRLEPDDDTECGCGHTFAEHDPTGQCTGTGATLDPIYGIPPDEECACSALVADVQ